MHAYSVIYIDSHIVNTLDSVCYTPTLISKQDDDTSVLVHRTRNLISSTPNLKNLYTTSDSATVISSVLLFHSIFGDGRSRDILESSSEGE